MLGSRPYPADVRKLLAQTVAAMPLLAAHTKLEGRISLQFQHDEGAVQLLIAQVEHGRGGSPETGLLVRGMAKANADAQGDFAARSEEHTSELQSLMRISYAVFCLK